MKRAVLASLCALAAGSALAQYKVVGPDGRVTYTDRPPPAAEGRAAPLRNGREVAAAPAQAALPTALREAATRFPVTRDAVAECTPCEAGRQLLRQRGIPFIERVAGTTAADRDAWLRVVGSPDAPALVIGGQWLRGYSPEQWSSYLDTAGYPRESRLPPNYLPPAPTPLVERVVQPAQPTPTAPAEVPPEPPAQEPGSIRF
jgi:glutaredoxin